MTLQIPSFESAYFEGENNLERMKDKLAIIMGNEVPTILIKQASDGITPLIEAGLVDLGYDIATEPEPSEYKVTRMLLLMKFARPYNKLHIEGRGYGVWPNQFTGGVVIRETTGISGPANVRMRQTKLKEVGSPSHRLYKFEPDKSQPIYAGR